MISADGLSVSYGGRPAVREVSFEVAPGEVVGLLGPNGAGKTSTMRALLGLLRPSAGSATIAASGRPVGFLPEGFVAYESLSVEGYLRFVAKAKGVGRSEVPDTVESAIARSGLSGLGSRPCGRLSHGQRQRVGWAQAIVGRPAACVLDEPTQGLDPQQVVEARALVRSLAADDGEAVLISTHLLSEAAQVCDRVVIVVGGRVAAVERPGEASDLEVRFLRLVAEDALALPRPPSSWPAGGES